MAGSPLAPSHPCHTRSISLPSRSHPVALRVEEELHKLKSYIATTSSTPEMMQAALSELATLYESVEELLGLPSNISSSEKKWLEKELDESIRLLDLCCAMKDSFTARKEDIKDLLLAIRRGDTAATQSKANAYIRSVKKANKDTKNCFRSLKQVDNKCINDTNNDLQTMVRLLMEVKNITGSLLQLVSSFFSTQTGRKNSSRWSFVAKALSKSKVAGEGEHEDIDFFSNFQRISLKDADDKRVEKFHTQLQTLEECFRDLENGLERLFRQLIHSRVTLLNILSS